MPYDGTKFETFDLTTARGRRGALIADLRSTWTNWKWDFSIISKDFPACGTAGCALGRAIVLGIPASWSSDLALTNEDYDAIFGIGSNNAQMPYRQLYGVRNRAEVTPLMVADALEAAPYYIDP